MKHFRKNDWLLMLVASYSSVTIAMNFFCQKSLSFGTSIIWTDAGLLISWMVFLIANIITEIYGKKVAVRVSTITSVVAFFISWVGVIITFIPTLPEYKEQAEAFSRIFSSGPRIIIGSTLAFWLGNFINILIIDKLRERTASDSKIKMGFRSVVSTIFGQLVDNGVFQFIAFAPLGISVYELSWKAILTSVLIVTSIETIVEAVFVPFITIPVIKYLKKLED